MILSAIRYWLGENQRITRSDSRLACLTADLAASQHVLLGSHSLLALKLCGCAVADRVTASTTGLLLADGHAYHEEMIEAVLPGLVKRLPPLVSGEKHVGFVDPRAAELLGLPAHVGLTVFHGCGDAGATTLGSARIRPPTTCLASSHCTRVRFGRMSSL